MKNLKILIAINSFKGSINSINAGNCIFKEIKKNFPDTKIKIIPVSDGGDGFIDCFKKFKGVKVINKKVKGPIFKSVLAKYIILSKSAYIEIAQACGIKYLKKNQLSPLKATSYGVGELILDAISKGAREIYLGLGGTASSDGGFGMAKALGFKFLNDSNKEIKNDIRDFINIKKILNPKNINFKKIKFYAITDVKNPLIGKYGSAKTYGPQKGANSKEILIIESGLINFAKRIKEFTKKDISKIKGGGSAGGLGAGLYGLLNAKIINGSKFIIKKLKLDKEIKKADIIITGEGKVDKTTFMGKIPGEIIKIASKYKKKIIIITGSLEKYKKNNTMNIILNYYFPKEYSKKFPDKAIKKAIQLNKLKIKNFIYKK